MSAPLDKLSREFTTALENHTYLGLSSSDPNKLQQMTTKQMRLTEVFKKAQLQIQKDLEDIQKGNAKDVSPEMQSLRLLQKQGKAYYQRYDQATKSWKRSFLKNLAYYTPSYLKRFLPHCFSNGMAAAEKETKAEYEKYTQFLTHSIDTLLTRPAQENKLLSQQNQAGNNILDTKEDADFQQAIAESLKLVKKPDDKDLTQPASSAFTLSQEEPPQNPNQADTWIGLINKHVQSIQAFNERPFTSQKCKEMLEACQNAVRHFLKLDPTNAQERLKQAGLNENLFKFFSSPELLKALATNHDQEILQCLPTDWKGSFQEALDQQGYIKFGVRRIPHSQDALELRSIDKEGLESRLIENNFFTYRGKIELHFTTAAQAQGLLTTLQKTLTDHATCRPCKITIKWADGINLTPEIFKLLLALSESVSEIQINDLKILNLKDCVSAANEDSLFVQHLESFSFPHLEKIILADDAKTKWTALDFSKLLAICPTPEFLKECYSLCWLPQNLVIPASLLDLTAWDLSHFQLKHISLLLPQLHNLTCLNLKGSPVTDFQLQEWVKKGYLTYIQSLQLDNCKSLTTNILPDLIKLAHLTQLFLPDLNVGTLPLNQLPKFADPFKIKLFYTSSSATQCMASSLYTGPLEWAATFQIPLARQNFTKVFAPRQKIIDSKSVAYWLHQKDYLKLDSQPDVKVIQADSNAELSDENVVEFVKKFPNVETLSLYHCPQITDKGIIQLLKKCPNIRHLDLTGCRLMTDALFLNDENRLIFNKLNKLIISDTGISSDIATIFLDEMGAKLVFEEMTLTIHNDQLTDEDSLEKILQAQALNKLKRLDLTGCTNLTNSMLAKVLDRLNNDMWIQKDGTLIDNPERLNLAVLNLKGCVQIDDEAFKSQQAGETIDFKLLETLGQMIIGGTKISECLTKVYPQIVFQEVEEEITLQMNPTAQLHACQAYYEKKQLIDQGDPAAQKELKKGAAEFIHNRIVVELFSDECPDQGFVHSVLSQPFQPHAVEFKDFTLSFKAHDQADPAVFSVHRDVLYSQSSYFAEGLRPGGLISQLPGLDCINQHATPEAAQVVMDLFYGKNFSRSLDWQTAAHAAELIGPKNFNLLPIHYRALLEHIHTKFDLDRADDMILTALQLEDAEGKKQYEATLISYLNDRSITSPLNFQKIVNIANNGYGFNTLLARVQTRQQQLTDQLIANLV